MYMQERDRMRESNREREREEEVNEVKHDRIGTG